MLQSIESKLARKVIILASGSPRRKEILENIKLPIIVKPSTFEENLDPKSFGSVAEFVKETARRKALDVAEKLQDSQNFDLIIGADTVVTFEGTVIGKPKNNEEAFSTLQRLSGNTHEVCSGVALIFRDQNTGAHRTALFDETSKVHMATLSDRVIQAYIATGEPRDKAGSYGIQGLGGTLITGIEGDYYNIVGFPLFKFCKRLFDEWS